MTAALVVNAGSSSFKYQLIEFEGERTLASGLVERIGDEGSRIVHKAAEGFVDERRIPDHPTAFRLVFEALGDLVDDLVAVGHRVVHGGELFSGPTLVDEDVLAALEQLIPLAPLHNPSAVMGIETARKHLPQLPQVAVFDTAFHASMPARARRYSLPRELADRLGVRRYGFHGISHAYVSRVAAAHLGLAPAEANLVTLHLGNGASATAVRGGVSVDTSMGLTPLPGLVMGTRGGDVDPGVVFHLHREAGLGLEEIEDLLTRRSGLVGLAGSGDLREVHRRADAGDADAEEALDLYCYRIRTFVGAYAAALSRVDAVVFTAGVGENDADVRARVCGGLDVLGIEIDVAANVAPERGVRTISTPDSRVAVLVVPTDEESEIARQARELVGA
jgi:acetate kinase